MACGHNYMVVAIYYSPIIRTLENKRNIVNQLSLHSKKGLLQIIDHNNFFVIISKAVANLFICDQPHFSCIFYLLNRIISYESLNALLPDELSKKIIN